MLSPFYFFFYFKKNKLITKTFRRFIDIKNHPFDFNKSILYQDEEFIVINKHYGHSTFGEKEKKESVKKSVHNMLHLKHSNLNNFNQKQTANIVYKLHSSVTGCVLVSLNAFIKQINFQNEFLALVYGIVEKGKMTPQIYEFNDKRIKEKNGEIKLFLKYLTNSNIMIPSNECQNLNELKSLKYSIISNISYRKKHFSFLKIFINANDCKYIKPLLFYGLCTCIVGDNEYINIYKHLKKNIFFSFLKNRQNIYNIKRSRNFLRNCLNHSNVKDTTDKVNLSNEKQKKYQTNDKNKNSENKETCNNIKKKELKLHLHCNKVIFETSHKKVISVSSHLPPHFQDTFRLLFKVNFKKNEQKNLYVKSEGLTREEQERKRKQTEEKQTEDEQTEDEQTEDETKRISDNYIELNELYNSEFYDSEQQKANVEENEILLNSIYQTNNKNKEKKRKRKGVLSKDIKKITKSDAPIFFTNLE